MTSTAVTSQILLARGCSGDDEAFAVLYARTFGPVFEAVRSVLRDPDQSEEVAQEVLLEVWLTGETFDAERAAITTWVRVIARRRAIDRVRAVEASRSRDLRIGVRDWHQPSDDVEHMVETRIEYLAALRALPSISNPQRRAIELSFVHGHTRAEVARMLGVPLSTANWHIRMGLANLRSALRPAV